ncbi:hypothetical protein RhiirA4_180397 [Rhizophagus irregularis]|uniref:Uncharacterized protein n=1 Tax=Rhizophagus irregularis TaxID=588596 RepID=A0A2I1GH84_9GLOM|nr:hypothetical protein RhiirA4_180397 [Rhizophagus irregularis]
MIFIKSISFSLFFLFDKFLPLSSNFFKLLFIVFRFRFVAAFPFFISRNIIFS